MSYSETGSVWKASDLDKFFIENVQGGQPYTAEMRKIMVRLIGANEPSYGNSKLSFLDLGCGNGILSKSILASYPDAEGVLVDFSESMLNIARENLKEKKNCVFLRVDLANKDWVERVDRKSFGAIVSGYAIHNFRTNDTSYREFYEQIFSLLRPGGLFLNLELVGLNSVWANSASHQLAVDSLTEFHKRKGSGMSGEAVSEEYGRLEGRKPFDVNRLPRHKSVEEHCAWLRSAGFEDVDCFFRVFGRAMVGGRRPSK